VISIVLMTRYVFDPPYIKRGAGRIDLWGIGALALGLGALQVFLDTGQRKDWFSSNYIRFFAAMAVIGLASLVIRELRTDHPVVDLRALANRSFSAGVFLISLLGFILYSSLVLLPIYLQTLLDYPAYNSGLALSPRGIGALIFTPIAGHFTGKTDPRRLLAIGLVLGSITMFQLSGLNLNAGYWDIFWPQVLQGVALSFLFIPLMALSMSGIAKEKMGNATSIFNLMRNIGGSVGIALMTTFLARRSQFHQSRLVEKISLGKVQTRSWLQGLTAFFHIKGADSYTASRKALGAVYGMVQRHATMLSFVEAFWLMGVLFLAMMPFLLLLRHSKPEAPAPVPSKLPAESHTLEETPPAVEEEEEELLALRG
jgi:MFS transporter, DHA2 family, multidrug resistance protein